MRSSGILLPIFSLPSKYGIGCFSKEAYEFVDFLKESGQKYWQILPMGPTSYGDSPYQSFSVFAGNPYFIDLETLINKKLLKESECCKIDFGRDENSVDYEKIFNNRLQILRKAYRRSNLVENESLTKFKEKNKYWLRDYAMFMAIKSERFGNESFDKWPEDIKNRWDYSLDYYKEELEDEIEFYEFLQYEFYTQWMSLKKYANSKGIQIVGDIPIYVAYDSADVWATPELFQMKGSRPVAVAGCPPDGFSPTGQLWGNPLYDWDYHEKTNYTWWINRINKCKELYDVIRIDHFRGFDEYYSIPYGAKNAVDGEWKKGPGIKLFSAIEEKCGETKIIAEDLGYITETVRKLVKETGYPNMKVLQFAFDARDSSGPKEYLPYNYSKNCVVYTGTHDNATILGWLEEMDEETIRDIYKYIGWKPSGKKELADEMIRMAHASTANMCIIPLQDYMLLGNESRINTPSTTGNNWRWRVEAKQINKKLATKIREYTSVYGRL